jgi:hypothetical protein
VASFEVVHDSRKRKITVPWLRGTRRKAQLSMGRAGGRTAARLMPLGAIMLDEAKAGLENVRACCAARGTWCGGLIDTLPKSSGTHRLVIRSEKPTPRSSSQLFAVLFQYGWRSGSVGIGYRSF